MPSPELTHPEVNQLLHFGLGKLPPPQAAAIETHLSDCEVCRHMVATVCDDPLILRLRALQGAAPERPMGEASGEQPELPCLGGYRLLRLLDQGGMGTVYLAEDVQLSRQVALKIMRAEIARRPEGRERFLREARTIAALHHDHIVPLFHVGQEEGLPFLVMPWLQGSSLESLLQEKRTWTLAEILRIGRETADGLAAAHERGIVHRDIKPSNLWLESTRATTDDDGANAWRVKILDFGLARLLEENEGLSRSGQVLGTPHYMAPEQARGGSVDGRADLFSLGAVLYRLSAGEPPPANYIAPRMTTLRPNISKPVEDLIMKLLAPNPADRPASAREVFRLLEKLEQSPQGVKLERSPKFRRAWLGIAAAMLLALSPIAYFFGPTILRIATNQGTVVIETDDPDIQIIIKSGGEHITIIDPKQAKEIDLKAGVYELQLSDKNGGLKLSTSEFELMRGGKRVVRVYREQPGPLPAASGKAAIASAKWVTKNPLPMPVFGASATVARGSLFLAGGRNDVTLDTLYLYEPAGDYWIPRPPLPKIDNGEVGRYYFALDAIGDKLYLAGGWRTKPPLPTNSLLLYDVKGALWQPVAAAPVLSASSGAGVIDGKFYLMTGWDGHDGMPKWFYVYDPKMNTWQERTKPPHAHVDGAVAAINGKLYVVGGLDTQGVTGVLDVYDPTTNTWTTKASLTTPRVRGGCAVFEGKMYVVGGSNKTGPLSSLECYDPATDQWTSGPAMPTPRENVAVAILNGTLFVIGGNAGLRVVEALPLQK